jgi:hypothetical protein
MTKECPASQNDDAVIEIRRILRKAIDDTSSLVRLTVFDTPGDLISSADFLHLPIEMEPEVSLGPEHVLFRGARALPDGRAVIRLQPAVGI